MHTFAITCNRAMHLYTLLHQHARQQNLTNVKHYVRKFLHFCPLFMVRSLSPGNSVMLVVFVLQQALQHTGYAYPGVAVEHFLAEAQKHGAELLSKRPVQSLIPADSGAILKGKHTC